MACNCEFKHRTTALTATGVFTVTNSNNVGNFDPFCFIVTIDPNDVIVGAPVAATVTVNGVNVPIIDRWGYPITTDRLCQRSCYRGRYIDSETPHVTLMNAFGNPNFTATAATTSTDTDVNPNVSNTRSTSK